MPLKCYRYWYFNVVESDDIKIGLVNELEFHEKYQKMTLPVKMFYDSFPHDEADVCFNVPTENIDKGFGVAKGPREMLYSSFAIKFANREGEIGCLILRIDNIVCH